MIHHINPAWWGFTRLTARTFHIYRLQSLTWCISIMIQLYLLRVVWAGVYADRDMLVGISEKTLLVYLTISALHRFFLPNLIDFYIQERVTSGRVAHDLVRPFGFLKQMIAMQLGSAVGLLPFLLVIVPAAIVVGSLAVPSAVNVILYFLSLALAFIVTLLIWLHVGLLSFWLLNVNGIRAMIAICSEFLAGALIPLWFMPGALRFALELLPFQATTFLPASIYSGQVTGTAVMEPLAVQLLWIVILTLSSSLVWNRAQRKLVVQGG